MLRSLDLTTALRPSLFPDETLLFVQDAVGLYGGKNKLAEYQNGHAYLTSHRACYVDNERPRERSVAIELRDVERCEPYAGFLKSSPKVTLIPKAAKFGPSGLPSPAPLKTNNSTPEQKPSRPALKDATWICPICSFSNAVPPNFDPALPNASTAISPCLACGIKPPLAHIGKAAINNLGSQRRAAESQFGADAVSPSMQATVGDAEDGVRCPRCTFQNHPSLTACEICGTSLVIASKSLPNGFPILGSISRSSSPAISQSVGVLSMDASEQVKFSFRVGGDKIFYERLKGALTQRKWLLQNAPPVPRPDDGADGPTTQRAERSKVGIAGLERRGAELRKNNEVVIGNAFEDLAALMASAKEIIALAESLSSQGEGEQSGDAATSAANESVADPHALLSQLNLTTTRDMLSSSKAASNNLYLTELCRSIAEFLTDDRRAVLKNAGGVMSLVDLWAVYNRARGGVELVSPTDFATGVELFDKLALPLRLRRFKSGLLVVQERSRTDEKTFTAILEWLRLHTEVPPDGDVTWEWQAWGRGITVQETAERFGWSIGVASEELELAEEHGALCRESGIEGVRFWRNYLGQADVIDPKAIQQARNQAIVEENLRQAGFC